MKLAKCAVVFDPVEHTYTLDGKPLQGVTGILSRRLFPDKYANIPQAVLEKAAQRGSYVHEMCDMVDTLDATPEDCQEAMNYKAMKQRLGLESVASEYLISDYSHYASSIDVVYKGESGVVLNDRKTTSKLDRESLSWQLSIYAVFFEQMNPDIPVEGLTATWLRGEICEYVPIERKPTEDVRALLEADINDLPFDYYPAEAIPDYIASKLDDMKFINERIVALQGELDTLKKDIEAQMVATETKSVSTPVASFSYIEPKTTLGFDQAKFKAEHPEIFSQYNTKATTKKGYLTIKFK